MATARNRRQVDRGIPRDELGRERLTVKFETRSIDEGADGAIPFTGHAAVFDKRTWIGPPEHGFWEQVDASAFTRTLDQADVRFLINHNPDLILGRTKAGTLSLESDDYGLLTRAQIPPTSYGKDLAISMARGDVNEMSFAFEPAKDGARWETLPDGKSLRTLTDLKLYDVSIVTYPAYEGTTAAMRSLMRELLVRQVEPSLPDADEDPTGLAEALDAVLDEVVAELQAEGYEGQALDLLTSAQTASDTLIAVLGGVDADEVGDADTAAPRSARRPAVSRTRRSAPPDGPRSPAPVARSRPSDLEYAELKLRATRPI